MPPFEALLQPLKIGPLTAKNRIEAAPTLTCIAHADQSVSSELVEFYRTQARGGAGIITVLETAIDADRAITQPTQLNLGTDFYIPALTSVAEVIKAGGAIASIQLNHGGRQAVSQLNGGRNPIGPSAMVGIFTEDRRRGEQVIEEMSLAMIDEVIDHFAAAAFRAKTAGFDMVMVHAGHGWLISQFISPAVNTRTDEYGGSLENRCRFGIRVIEAIRERCGADFPIEWRISASDLVPGGLEIADAVRYAQIMQDKVDLLQVSAGTIGVPHTYPYTHPSTYLPHGENLERAAEIKKAVRTPVGVVGAIVDLDEAGEWVAAGKVDFVALCRALIADPALPKKTFRGRKQDAIPCIRCNSLPHPRGPQPAGEVRRQPGGGEGGLLPLRSAGGREGEEGGRGRRRSRRHGSGAGRLLPGAQRHLVREGRPARRQPAGRGRPRFQGRLEAVRRLHPAADGRLESGRQTGHRGHGRPGEGGSPRRSGRRGRGRAGPAATSRVWMGPT